MSEQTKTSRHGTTRVWGFLVAAAAVAAIFAVVGTASAAAAARKVCGTENRLASLPAANGSDVIVPNGGVYQLARGSFHLIPNTPTANAMGLSWSHLMPAVRIRIEGYPALARQAATANAVKIAPIGAPLPSVCGG